MFLSREPTGNVQISLIMESGSDAGIGKVSVRKKMQVAMPLLPQAVQQQGVGVKSASSSILMVVGVINT
ncbi:efflux RND transporter permease subunit, partial [Escherichia coli]|uniref:efflux RND transporter permease subunit n=1 Tax=Escherichia coli TaxID=562 RepID=UPI003F50D5FB